MLCSRRSVVAHVATPRASMSPASQAERRARLQSLQARLRDSSRANRSDVVAEQAKQREAAQKRSTAHAHKLAKAERLLDERDMRERGEDVERHRAMHYTIEENEAWEKKLEEKERKRDKGMIGASTPLTQTFRTWPSARTSGRSSNSSRTTRPTSSKNAQKPKRHPANSCTVPLPQWRRTGRMHRTKTPWTAS